MGRVDPHLVGITPGTRQAEISADLLSRLSTQERLGTGSSTTITGSVADATTTVKGKLKLAGDFEGTADLPYLRKGTSTDSGTLGVYDLRRFGATEGGDILAALQAAQTAMPAYGGEIHINLWRVNLSGTFTITKPIRIVGLGRGTYNRAEDLAGGAAFYNPTTIITWSGSSGGGPFFHTNGNSRPLGDVWFKNLACNGNNLAGLVFDFDRTQDGGMENIIVKSMGAAGVALRLRTARGESVTVQNAANTITLSNHGYDNGDVVYVSGTGVPGGLTAHTAYYVVGATTNTLQLALTAGGAAIDITSDGSAVILSDQPANQPHVHNTQNCTFTHLHFDCPLPIEMLGGQGRQEVTSQLWNVCLNHFEDVKLAYGYTDATGLSENTNGMDIWDGDNNTFVKFRVQHLGSGTGYGIDFHAAARGNYFFHTELEGGCRVRVPDSLSAGHLNHIEGYDRTNTEPLPTIDAGARLRWTASGHSATGHWINAGQTSQINGSTYYSLFVGGEVSGQPRPNVEIAAKTYVNDSTASFDAVGKDGATDVWGRVAARDTGDIIVGAASDHPVLFMKNATEVFRINAGNHLQWGADSVPIELYRAAANIFRIDGISETGGGLGINRSDGGAPASAAAGYFLGAAGAYQGYRASTGIHFRVYSGTEANPRLLIQSGATNTLLKVDAPTSSEARIDLAENGTTQWRIDHDTTTGNLKVEDIPGSRVPIEVTDDGQVFFSATPTTYTSGAVYFGASAAVDGSGGGQKIRAMFNQAAGYTGGVNVRASAPTNDDTRHDQTNQSGSTFYQPVNSSHTLDSFGSLIAIQANVTQTKKSGATFPDTYAETSGFVCGNTQNNKGGFAQGMELGNVFNSSTQNANAGPGHNRAAIMWINEQNLYSAFNDTAIFGSSSRYLNGGSAGLHIQSGGAGYIGTGLFLFGTGGSSETSAPSGFKRAIVLRDRSENEIFCIDGAGNIGVRRATDQSQTLGYALTVGYTAALAASTAAADGIGFGGDVELYRGAANLLVTPDGLQSLNLNVVGGSNNGYVQFTEQSGNVPAGAAGTLCRMYMKGDKLVIVFNNGGTSTYSYLDLIAGGWTTSTTAP